MRSLISPCHETLGIVIPFRGGKKPPTLVYYDASREEQDDIDGLVCVTSCWEKVPKLPQLLTSILKTARQA